MSDPHAPAARNHLHAFDASAIAALWLITAHLLLVGGGFLIFSDASVMVGGNKIPQPRALFTAVNVCTLTGFQQSIALDQMLPRGQYAAMATMLASAFCAMGASSLAVVKLLKLRWSIMRVLASAAIALIAATTLGGGLLITTERGIFASLFQAASAFSNCGLTIGPPTAPNDFRTLLVLLPLSILGGIGLPVLMDVYHAIRHATPLHSHTRIVIGWLAGVFIVGLIWCVWTALPSVIPLQGLNGAMTSGLLATLNTRSAGLPLETIYSTPRALQWLMMLMMAIGAAPAGAGGGLKVTTLFVLARGGVRSLRGNAPGRLFGIAVMWITCYVAIVFIALLTFLQNQPQIPGDRALFIIISAASNAGLSHDPLSVTVANAYILSVTMLLGRIVPIFILWWAALTVRDADVAVG